jgi:hypothetical protein
MSSSTTLSLRSRLTFVLLKSRLTSVTSVTSATPVVSPTEEAIEERRAGRRPRTTGDGESSKLSALAVESLRLSAGEMGVMVAKKASLVVWTGVGVRLA